MLWTDRARGALPAPPDRLPRLLRLEVAASPGERFGMVREGLGRIQRESRRAPQCRSGLRVALGVGAVSAALAGYGESSSPALSRGVRDQQESSAPGVASPGDVSHEVGGLSGNCLKTAR
jgi:hypothetical protein